MDAKSSGKKSCEAYPRVRMTLDDACTEYGIRCACGFELPMERTHVRSVDQTWAEYRCHWERTNGAP